MRETKRANKDGKLILYPEGKPGEPHFVITAWNPGGLKQSTYDNAMNHKKLSGLLFEAQSVTGAAEIFDSEKSWRMTAFYVMAIPEDKLHEIARSIGQNVIYYIDEEGQKTALPVNMNPS